MNIETIVPITGILALLFAFFLYLKVVKESPGNEKMIEISTMIEKGAMAFIKSEYIVFKFGRK